jgi:hypothetical protein
MVLIPLYYSFVLKPVLLSFWSRDRFINVSIQPLAALVFYQPKNPKTPIGIECTDAQTVNKPKIGSVEILSFIS